MKKILLLLMLLTLVSCNYKIDGTLNVLEGFTLIDKKDKQRTFEVGSYDKAKVKVKSNNKVELKVKLDGKKRKFPVIVDSDVSFPEYSGEVFYTADENNQNYDLKVNVETEETIGPTQTTYESCVNHVQRWLCNHNGCSYQTVPEHGERRVVYHNIVRDTEALVVFLTPDSDDVVANFEGERQEVTRVIEDSGFCRSSSW